MIAAAPLKNAWLLFPVSNKQFIMHAMHTMCIIICEGCILWMRYVLDCANMPDFISLQNLILAWLCSRSYFHFFYHLPVWVCGIQVQDIFIFRMYLQTNYYWCTCVASTLVRYLPNYTNKLTGKVLEAVAEAKREKGSFTGA